MKRIFLCFALATGLWADTLTTFNFAGSTINQLVSTGQAKIDLGSNYGLATFRAVTSGTNPNFTRSFAWEVPDTVHNLSNGDVLNYTSEWVVVFGQANPGQATDAALHFTITLDDPTKLFRANTAFIAYSMDRSAAGPSNGFVPGSGLGAPRLGDPATRSDFLSTGVGLARQPDGSYRATTVGTSEGRIFPLLAPTNSFDFNLVSNIGAQGVGFAFALPETALVVPTPEPAAYGLFGLGAAIWAVARRRARR